MHAFKAALVGSDEKTLPHIRRELLNLDIDLAVECLDLGHANSALRSLAAQMPLLVVVHLEGEHQLNHLERLCHDLKGTPFVCLVNESGDTSLPLRCMRTGVSQIVLLPLHPAEFHTAVERATTVFTHEHHEANVIAVAGAGGGCGATMLAVNLAYEIALLHEKQTVLVELAPHMGAVASYLDLTPRHTMHDVLQVIDRLDSHLLRQILTPYVERLQVLPGPIEVIPDGNLCGVHVPVIVDCLRRLADVVVLTIPCTHDDMYFRTLELASHVVLVGEPTLPSLRSLKLVTDAIRVADPGREPILVVNKFNPRRLGFDMNLIRNGLQPYEPMTVASDVNGVTRSINDGRPLRVEAPKSPALPDIARLASRLVGPPPHESSHGTVLERLGHLLHS